MARPAKQGLDYFALDVTMNDEVEIIEATHGLEGFAILIKLFQKIYSEGYFYEWGDKEQILFSKRVSVDRNKVASIVNDCINWGIFSKTMFEKYNILTSKRIQNHYLASVYKRSNIEIIKDYMLIKSDITDRSNVTYIGVSDVNNLDTTIDTDIGNKDTSIVSDVQSTQSKVKESKVNKIKENKNNMSNTECSTEENPATNLADNQSANSRPVNYQKIQEDYNAICSAMPKCRSMTDKRKKKVRVLFKNLGEDIEAVRLIFEKAQASDFLSGRNGRWTSCNFDWLVNYNNAIKVLEGNYDNKSSVAKETKYDGIREWLNSD